MITASEARNNVIQHEVEEYKKVGDKVMELIETMSKSIEFHSKSGIDHLDFSPFDKSRFPLLS